jgi:hypothetical protein
MQSAAAGPKLLTNRQSFGELPKWAGKLTTREELKRASLPPFDDEARLRFRRAARQLAAERRVVQNRHVDYHAPPYERAEYFNRRAIDELR